MNKWKTIRKLSGMELERTLRSTKIIVLALFVIFMNIQIITPLRALSIAMGGKLSLLEPFAAAGNSGVVVLMLPLFYLTMMADFPQEGENGYFYRIRCGKRTWVAGQIAYAAVSSVMLTVFVFAASVLLSLDFISKSPDYSYAVTRYVAVFPERAGEYVVQLVPENLYNQIPLPVAVFHTAFLLMLYFMMLAMLILLFSLIKRKIVGIFLDGVIILAGTVSCAGRMAYMWVFPMAHTIPWLHYPEYRSKAVLPMGCSYLYFCIIDAVLATLSFAMSKHGNGV